MSQHRQERQDKRWRIDVVGVAALLFAVVVGLCWASGAEARSLIGGPAFDAKAVCVNCKTHAHLHVPGQHRCSLGLRPSIVTLAPRASSFAMGSKSQDGLLPFDMRRQVADAWTKPPAPSAPPSIVLETFKSVFGKTRRMHA